jgi:hypothetical protein
MMLIGISGKAGSGKDTAKQMIVDELESRGLKPVTLSFAGPLKDALVLWFGWDRQRLDSDFPYKEGGLGNSPGLPDDIDPICVAFQMTRREIMQKFGTECMRHGLHSDFWIKLAEYHINIGRIQGDVFIISDARFTNELNWVKEHDGFTLLLERVDVEVGESWDSAMSRYERGEDTATLTDKTGHTSETEFGSWPHFTLSMVNLVDKNLDVETSKIKFRKMIADEVIPDMIETLGLNRV